MYGMRLARWSQMMDWPLIGAALLFMAAYALQILGPGSEPFQSILEIVLWATWALFAVDYVVSLWIAEKRGRWFVRHLLDLLIVVLPMLRPLRLMRFLTVLTIIQKNVGTALRGRVAIYTLGATAITIFMASLAVFDAERGHLGANIKDFGEAVWWSFTTITTVGYGDFYPVTMIGRIVAVALMIGGIALIGDVTATLASWIVERVAGGVTKAEATTSEQLAEIAGRVAALQRAIEERQPREGSP